MQQRVLPASISTEPDAELLKHVRLVKIVEMPSGRRILFQSTETRLVCVSSRVAACEDVERVVNVRATEAC